MRLKITDAPYFVKIPVRLKISVHQWASRPEWCKCSGHLKGLHRRAGEPERMQEHTTTEGEQESHKERTGEDAGRRAKTKKFFVLYIGTEKYLQKMLKKIASIEICCTFAS